MIENEYLRRGKLLFLFIYLFFCIHQLSKNFFSNQPSITRPDGNIDSAYAHRLRVKGERGPRAIRNQQGFHDLPAWAL